MIVIACRWSRTSPISIYGPWGNPNKSAEDEPQVVAAAKHFFAIEAEKRGGQPIEAAIYVPDCTGRHKMPIFEQYIKGEWR